MTSVARRAAASAFELVATNPLATLAAVGTTFGIVAGAIAGAIYGPAIGMYAAAGTALFGAMSAALMDGVVPDVQSHAEVIADRLNGPSGRR